MYAGLQAIETKTYTSDYHFHLDLVVLFNQLNDGHTLYYSPSGYRRFFKIRPFYLTSSIDIESGDQEIIVSFGTLPNYQNLTGVDLTPYIGLTVSKINGVDALEYVKVFYS